MRSLQDEFEIEVNVKGIFDVIDFYFCFNFIFVHNKTIEYF